MSSRPSNLFVVDLLKVIASQLIILHHLAFYGPMSDVAEPLIPDLTEWLSEYGRMAVQAFLVAGGFLAARSLAPEGHATFQGLWTVVKKRYLRLIPPLIVALGICIAASTIARAWMTHDSIPLAPTLVQLVAHVTLLQDVLDIDALSAGVWYVAIDLQLYVLMATLLWLIRSLSGSRKTSNMLAPSIMLLLVIASLYYFNRDADWDMWALYFVGAYGLGALAYWSRLRADWMVWLAVMLVVTGIALEVDFRERIVVALAVAIMLVLAVRPQVVQAIHGIAHTVGARAVKWLATMSYPVFLIHFGICLLVNAAFVRFDIDDPALNLAGMVAAWLASNVAGAALHYALAGSPLQRLRHAIAA